MIKEVFCYTTKEGQNVWMETEGSNVFGLPINCTRVGFFYSNNENKDEKLISELKKETADARKQVEALIDKYNDQLNENEKLQIKFDFLMDLYREKN
jgi:hypothetical protein